MLDYKGKVQPFLINAVHGCSDSEIEQMKELAAGITGKPVAALKHWEVSELYAPAVLLEILEKDKAALPATLSGKLVCSASDRFEAGDKIRTSNITGAHNKCLVETLNTCYVIVGEGIFIFRSESGEVSETAIPSENLGA